jgi:5'-methylthioadenosine phosphorylase
MPAIGVIGGSGLYEIEGFEKLEERRAKTPHGEPSAPYVIGRAGDRELAFLPRHGKGHAIQPHRVNYKANIWGFRELGVERILSVCAAGGISEGMAPGELVVLDQVIDFTQGARPSTFHEGDKVVHVDFTEPYCPELRASLLEGAKGSGIKTKGRGTYICVNGPRLESRAEILFYRGAGADLVGMTGMPEAVLARELAMCYASVAVVTNFAAGLTGEKLTTSEVVDAMGRAAGDISGLIGAAINVISAERACPCRDSLKGASM